MKERPILFSGPMVSAILAGRKTQTRRLVKLNEKTILSLGQRKAGFEYDISLARVGDVGAVVSALAGKERPATSQQISIPVRHPGDDSIPFADCGYERLYCPYGGPGSRLWVKESYRLERKWDDYAPGEVLADIPPAVWYEADERSTPIADSPWGKLRPSIHMPWKIRRITLEVTSVRVERVQDISEADAIAEGLEGGESFKGGGEGRLFTPRENFLRLFYDINKRAPRDANPWVWVVEFKRLEAAHA